MTTVEREDLLADVQSFLFKEMAPKTAKEILNAVMAPKNLATTSQFSTFLKENQTSINIVYEPGKNKKAGTWFLAKGSYVEK